MASRSQKLEVVNRNPDHKQDRVNPFLINTETGHVFPNTPLLRKEPNMRLYTADVNMPLEERMRWLSGATKRMASPKVINTVEDDRVFDMAAATKDELIVFAFENYNVTLPNSLSVKHLRDQVSKLANAAHAEDLAA